MSFDPDHFDRPVEQSRRENATKRAAEARAKPSGAARPTLQPVDAARPPAFSDDALALRFAERHANDLRFVAAWNKWLSWTGKRWRFDDTLACFRLNPARSAARRRPNATRARLAVALASAKTVAAVDKLAKADRRIAATIDQWDADPWLLNTPDGVVDLRTGRTRAHRPDDYHDQDHGGRAARRLSALPRLPRQDHRRRRRARILPSARTRLRPHRRHPRACAVLRLWHGRQRQERAAFDRRRDFGRISPHRADRDLRRQQRRSSPDRPGRPPRRASRHRNRNRGRPPLGRGTDQAADRRATPSRRASCARTSSSTGQRSSSSSPATTSHRSDRSTRPSGGASTDPVRCDDPAR